MKTVLITGGTKGLGFATARAFGNEGAKLILTYRSDHENAEKAKASLKKDQIDCHLIAEDLSEEGASDRLFQKLSTLTQTIDVYVHNAAATAFKSLIEMKPHHVEKTYRVTVGSLIQNVQHLMPFMKNGGSVVTVSGIDTKQTIPLHGLLASAKASLECLTTYFAHELADKNIRFNGVNPGYLETDSTKKNFGPLFEKAVEFAEKLTPGARRPCLDDVASVIVFLASDKSKWILGQTIMVDGGQAAISPLSALTKSIL